MNDTTNNFIQIDPGFKTSRQEEKLPYQAIDPKVNYITEKPGVVFDHEEIGDDTSVLDMTKGQWKKYYKKMGLE